MGSEGPPHSVPERYSRRPAAMRFTVIAVLCACVALAAADGHLRAKAKLLGKLAGKLKHHKRGVYSSAPPYKHGYDIPHVTHSIVKPVVVSYPPTAAVTAVKVPVQHPLINKYPVHVGHKVPSLHHYAHKFPHHTHTKVIPRPDQHFHHHHHHVAPRPVVPILPAHGIPAAPIVPTLPVPIPQPSVTIPHPIPAPSPPITPILPATPQFILPQNHVHFKPVLPAPVPIQPAPVAPLYPYAPQYSYAIRPGNAVQTSFFATYPRYPLVNFQQSVVPLAPAALAPSVAPGPVFLERPQQPHFHVVPQAHAHGVVEQPTPAVAVEPTFLHPTQAAIPQPTVHLQPAQPTVHLDHNGWAPVPHGHDLAVQQEHHHFAQPDLIPTQETHFAQPHEHFTQEQGQQVYEHHTGEEQYHDYQQHLQHHIQQQLGQAQYEQNLHNHQLGQEYGQPNVDYSQQNHDISQHEYEQHAHEYAQHAQDFAHQQAQDFAHQQTHDFAHQQAQDFAHHQAQDFAHQQVQDFAHQQGQDFAHQQAQDFAHQQAQDFAHQQAHDFSQHQQDFSQHGHDYAQHDLQSQQEYGVPQHHVLEGRSEEAGAEEEPQRFHNHIPLGLQLPLDRPLEHFR